MVVPNGPSNVNETSNQFNQLRVGGIHRIHTCKEYIIEVYIYQNTDASVYTQSSVPQFPRRKGSTRRLVSKRRFFGGKINGSKKFEG